MSCILAAGRRFLAFVLSLFTAACGSGPRTFVDVENGDVQLTAADVEALRGLLASAGLRAEELGVEGELASASGHWVEIDGDGHVWSAGLSGVPGLDELTPLSGLPRLTRVVIRGARLVDFTGLRDAVELEHLAVVASGLSDFGELENCRKLKLLDLRDNDFESLDGLPDLPALRILDLGGNRITAAGGAIAGRDALESLDLSDNALHTVAGIGELPRLERLSLNRNRLTSLAGLVGLPRLKELQVADNRLTDAAALDALPALEIVNLNGNRLEEFPRLVSRLPQHLWQENPGTRRYWAAELDEQRR